MLMKKIFIGKTQSKSSRVWVTVIVLAALALSAFSWWPAGRQAFMAFREDAVLIRLIEAAGAEFDTVNITGWVRVEESLSEPVDPEALAWGAATRLGLPESGRRSEKWQNSLARGVKLESKNSEGLTFTVLAQTLAQPEGKGLSHIMVSTSSPERLEARRLKQAISDTLSAYGADGRVALTYAGKTRGAMEDEELLACAEKMMMLAGASIQEKTLAGNLVSLTGFSPRLAGEISYAGREINLNVALRRNPVEGATYVYAASPVILTEY